MQVNAALKTQFTGAVTLRFTLRVDRSLEEN
jgi:hypothetical protein